MRGPIPKMAKSRTARKRTEKTIRALKILLRRIGFFIWEEGGINEI